MTSGAVVTLTPAGAIDATYVVATIAVGEFVRAEGYARELSGKGVNLSAALSHTDIATRAVVVMGEDDVAFVDRGEERGILVPVTVPGSTRVNTSVIDGAGRTTKVNAPVPALSAEAWGRACDAARDAIAAVDAEWFVLCGSLPVVDGRPGAEAASALVADLSTRGVRVAVDTSGPALATLTADGGTVAMIKPNTHELAEIAKRNLRTVGDVVDAAREIIHRGVQTVYVSMGADGALAVTAERVVHAHAAAVRVVNTAGAGDASLAGFLAGWAHAERDGDDLLAGAVASAARWGAHAVAQATTLVPSLEGMPAASVDSDPSRDRLLSEPAVVEV